jgi:hypothetical protein
MNNSASVIENVPSVDKIAAGAPASSNPLLHEASDLWAGASNTKAAGSPLAAGLALGHKSIGTQILDEFSKGEASLLNAKPMDWQSSVKPLNSDKAASGITAGNAIVMHDGRPHLDFTGKDIYSLAAIEAANDRVGIDYNKV